MIEIRVDTHHWITREIDPDDDWDNGATDGDITGVTAFYHEGQKDRGYRGMGWGHGFYDIDAGPGDTVHALIAKYGTGNTFGSEGCQISVMDVFTEVSDAVNLHQELKGIGDFRTTVRGRDYYIPWVGYFEWLQELSVRTLVVQNGYSYTLE